MLLKGTRGSLLRSIDKTVDGKVFLKLDAENLSAWNVCMQGVEEHLRLAVYPDDHTLVFRGEEQTLTFSDPWLKFKDGQLTRNVLDLPCKASLAYVERCQAKFTPKNVTPGIKKRAHSNVSSDGTLTTTSTTTTQFTAERRVAVTEVAIDLTEEDGKPASSPNHKVQIIEQRVFHANTSPVSSMEGSATLSANAASPKSARMQQLERRVEAHDVRLTAIQTSVCDLDTKIVSQHQETSFHFRKFHEMLNHIHEQIVAGVAKAAPAQTEQLTVVDEELPDEDRYEEGAFNPIQHQYDWHQTWKEKLRRKVSVLTIT